MDGNQRLMNKKNSLTIMKYPYIMKTSTSRKSPRLSTAINWKATCGRWSMTRMKLNSYAMGLEMGLTWATVDQKQGWTP